MKKRLLVALAFLGVSGLLQGMDAPSPSFINIKAGSDEADKKSVGANYEGPIFGETIQERKTSFVNAGVPLVIARVGVDGGRGRILYRYYHLQTLHGYVYADFDQWHQLNPGNPPDEPKKFSYKPLPHFLGEKRWTYSQQSLKDPELLYDWSKTNIGPEEVGFDVEDFYVRDVYAENVYYHVKVHFGELSPRPLQSGQIVDPQRTPIIGNIDYYVLFPDVQENRLYHLGSEDDLAARLHDQKFTVALRNFFRSYYTISEKVGASKALTRQERAELLFKLGDVAEKWVDVRTARMLSPKSYMAADKLKQTPIAGLSTALTRMRTDATPAAKNQAIQAANRIVAKVTQPAEPEEEMDEAAFMAMMFGAARGQQKELVEFQDKVASIALEARNKASELAPKASGMFEETLKDRIDEAREAVETVAQKQAATKRVLGTVPAGIRTCVKNLWNAGEEMHTALNAWRQARDAAKTAAKTKLDWTISKAEALIAGEAVPCRPDGARTPPPTELAEGLPEKITSVIGTGTTSIPAFEAELREFGGYNVTQLKKVMLNSLLDEQNKFLRQAGKTPQGYAPGNPASMLAAAKANQAKLQALLTGAPAAKRVMPRQAMLLAAQRAVLQRPRHYEQPPAPTESKKFPDVVKIDKRPARAELSSAQKEKLNSGRDFVWTGQWTTPTGTTFNDYFTKYSKQGPMIIARLVLFDVEDELLSYRYYSMPQVHEYMYDDRKFKGFETTRYNQIAGRGIQTSPKHVFDPIDTNKFVTARIHYYALTPDGNQFVHLGDDRTMIEYATTNFTYFPLTKRLRNLVVAFAGIDRQAYPQAYEVHAPSQAKDKANLYLMVGDVLHNYHKKPDAAKPFYTKAAEEMESRHVDQLKIKEFYQSGGSTLTHEKTVTPQTLRDFVAGRRKTIW